MQVFQAAFFLNSVGSALQATDSVISLFNMMLCDSLR